MKVDLVYPKIPENSDKFHGKCIAFEKYDGTNLHWKWNRQDGWHAFGTRRTQFPFTRNGIAEFFKEHVELADAPHIFNDSLRDKLSMFFPQHYMFSGFDITLFTEFYGPNSFAGGHVEEEHQLIIIDVMQNNRLIAPEIFHEFFHEFGCAQIIYTGKYSGQFAEDVRKGKYDVNEGVVVKGMVDGQVFMTKIKTKDYLKRLEKR